MTALSFKQRFVYPIRKGLGIPIESMDGLDFVPKLQTIRAGAPNGQGEAYSKGGRLLARIGAELKLYCGMRTKHCFLIGTGRCTSLHRVVIWPDSMTILIDGKLIGTRRMLAPVRADGFVNALDMRAFWKKEHPDVQKFNGVLIKWEPIVCGQPALTRMSA
jgi:hypothetical protein